MRYMDPHTALHLVYLDEKSVPRHRSNRRPLPRHVVGDEILFFIGKHVISWQMYKDFFLYVKDRPELLNPAYIPDYKALPPSGHATEDETEGTEDAEDYYDRELPEYMRSLRPEIDVCHVPFPVELRIKEMSIQEVESRPWEKPALTRCRDKCMRKMYKAFTEEKGFPESIAVRELSVRFKLPTSTIRRVLRMADLGKSDIRLIRNRLGGDYRVDIINHCVRNAQALAVARKIYGGFALKDVLPHHPGSTDQYIPPHCPVLGLELEYDREKKKQLNAVRVGRKDTRRPFEAGNVAIMSYLAARLIEGTISDNKISIAADHDIASNWRTWSRDHVTNWGKTKLGRPSKKKDKVVVNED